MAKAKRVYVYNEDWYLPRLSETGAKVRRAIAIVYIEDLEKAGKSYYDLLGFLDHLHIKAVVSPIHDMDVFSPEDVLDWCARHRDPETGDVDVKYCDYERDPSTGEVLKDPKTGKPFSKAPYVGKPKKKHCHIGLLLTNQLDAYELSDLLKPVLYIRPSMWDKMQDYGPFLRYLAHLDSPQKAKYSPFDIVGFGGVDLSPLIKDDATAKLATFGEVLQVVQQKKIKYFHQLVNTAFRSGDLDMQNCVISKASLFANYYRSMAQERMDEAEKEKRAKSAAAAGDITNKHANDCSEVKAG